MEPRGTRVNKKKKRKEKNERKKEKKRHLLTNQTH